MIFLEHNSHFLNVSCEYNANFFCHRVMLTIGCPMKFHNYPMDTQTCRLALQSFGYDLNHNFYQWLRPPRIRRDINLDNHEIKMTHFNFTYSSEGKENIITPSQDCTRP